ncbi:MAG: lamin tail domain-containing protein, partial [Chthoniobacteraceae bacterium]
AQNNVENKLFPYKKCAVEMVLPDGTTAFSTICGIGGHGNASRTPSKNPKHGFQLKFKGEFGPGSLNYPLFPDAPVQQYDDVILRPDFGTSWRHWSDVQSLGNGQRTRATRTRDAFIKNTFRDMGRLASHHRFVHLFINGIYWGTYDYAEQPVEGFVSANAGGTKQEYAIIHEGVAKNGADPIYNSMTAMPGITTNALYEQMKGYLNVPQFADYMLLQFFVGAQDWGTVKNWYAYRRRATPANPSEGKYHYIPWDEENTLLDTGLPGELSTIDRINADTNSLGLPSGLHQKLISHPQYKLDFADRVHKHLIAPGGALTYAANVARWQRWQAILDKPIVAESCRWGDYRRDVHPYQNGVYALYTRENHWLAENTRMTKVGGYFQTRVGTVLGQLRVPGLYPSATNAAPEYRQDTTSGTVVGTSRVNAGFVVAMNGAGNPGTIYYTTDGNDPHIYYTPTTGATATSVAATAQTYAAPLTINATTTVKSRMLNAGVWSALNEATFSVGLQATPIRITEIMYNPPNGNGGTSAEFLELQNVGALPVDLSGFSFDGIDFVFPLGFTIGAGDRIVLANNNSPTTFTAVYPGVGVAGYFGGNLSNTGEHIALLEPSGRTVTSVTYGTTTPWAVQPNGGGYSLEVIDADGDANSPFNWKASNAAKGTPGLPNSALPALGVKLSEVLADNVSAVSNGGLFSRCIELQNSSANPVDISGWRVITGASVSPFAFPAGTVLPAGGFTTVWLDGGSGGTGFHAPTLALSGSGGTVRLYQTADLSGTPLDQVEFGNQATNFSIGRVLVSTSPDVFAWKLTQPSPGAANAATTTAPVSDLALNEWLANQSSVDTSDWFELYNRNATLPAALPGVSFQTSTQLFQYRKLSFLNPHGYLRLNCTENGGDVDFNLPSAGTVLSILDASGTVTESVNISSQPAGYSEG